MKEFPSTERRPRPWILASPCYSERDKKERHDIGHSPLHKIGILSGKVDWHLRSWKHAIYASKAPQTHDPCLRQPLKINLSQCQNARCRAFDGATLINLNRVSAWPCPILAYSYILVAGCGKPAYFTEKKPLFEVQTSTGLLHNTNGGSAITPIGEADLPNPGFDSSAPIGLNASAKGVRARAFQGGNHWDLHKMLEVKSGSEV